MTATTATMRQGRSEFDPPQDVPALERALNLDLTQPLAFVAFALVYIASRLPFINIGYGTDPDAWRVALSGYWLWDNAEFYPSRLPGYPIPEYASAAVIKGGWVATNMLTVLVSLLGVWFFARIAEKLELPDRSLIVIGFAFTPLLWINSMTTMDYMYALTFILGCYYFLLREDTSLAGVMLGLAAASRPTSLLFLIPFLVYLWRDGKRGETREFVVWTIFVPIIAYLPIAWRYGVGFLTFYDAKVGYLNVLRLLGKDTLGLLGSMAVIAAIIVSLPRLRRLPRDFIRDKHVDVWLLAIAITVVVFLRLPHESAYLIPLYPFGFFMMARYFQRYVLAAVVAVIILAGFVDLTSPGDQINSRAFTHARLGQGLVLSNRDTMLLQKQFARDVADYAVPNNSVVALGFIYPEFAVLNRDRLQPGILRKDTSSISQLSDKGRADDFARRITYVWLMDPEDFDKLKKEGRTFLYTQDAGRSTAALYDYRLGIEGGKLIDLGRGPSGSSGAARTDR